MKNQVVYVVISNTGKIVGVFDYYIEALKFAQADTITPVMVGKVDRTRKQCENEAEIIMATENEFENPDVFEDEEEPNEMEFDCDGDCANCPDPCPEYEEDEDEDEVEFDEDEDEDEDDDEDTFEGEGNRRVIPIPIPGGVMFVVCGE